MGVCYRRGVVCVSYTSLGGGREGAEALVNNAVVNRIAKETGRSVSQVWAHLSMQQPQLGFTPRTSLITFLMVVVLLLLLPLLRLPFAACNAAALFLAIFLLVGAAQV